MWKRRSRALLLSSIGWSVKRFSKRNRPNMKPSVLMSLGSKLHPPLPLSPRESQLLLSVLTSTFRKHLNQEYPTFRKTEEYQGSISRSAIERSHGSIREPQSLGSSSTSELMSTKAANLHFQSVLTNPLFVGPKRRRSSSRRRSNDGLEGNIQDSRWLMRLMSDPMGFFEENVAAGTATFEVATTCLKSHMNDILKSPALSVKEAMAKSDAGTKVMGWLFSSGLIDSKEVVENEDFASALIPFLTAKGRSKVYISWMKRLVPADPGIGVFPQAAVKLAQQQSFLIRMLINSETRYGGGCDAALGLFDLLAAHTYRSLPPYLRKGITPLAFNNITLSPAGKSLCKFLVDANIDLHPSPTAFERFMSWIPRFVPEHEHLTARLLLHHPTDPSADLALKVLKAREVSFETQQRRIDRRRWVKFSLETAQILLNQERWADGAWVLEFLQKAFPEELGIRHRDGESTQRISTSPRNDPSLDEQVNIKLLEGLDLNVR